MTTPVEPIKVDLSLRASANAEAVASTCAAQSALIKQCSAYATTPAVQTVVVALDTAVAALQGTVSKIVALEAEVSTLKKTRTVQVSAVRLAHDAVQTAVNTASNNDPQAAQAWVGKTKSRAKPAPVTTSTVPPAGALLQIVKKTPGNVKATCTAEESAVSYLFQTGTDPAHPETWPAALVSRGHTFTFRNLAVGQTFYARIAVVRRGSVQSLWTPVLQIVVR